MRETKTAPCRITVDEECLTAYLLFSPDAVATGISRYELAGLLAEAKIKFTPGLEKRLDKLASILKTGKLPTKPVLIAKGRPADHGDDGKFELNPELEPKSGGDDESDRVNFYEQHKILAVTEGQVLGKIHPPRPSKQGEDVFGQPIKPPGKCREVAVGSNVRLDEDGVTALATCDGRLDYDTFRIAVLDVVEIPGDVDFETGNIDSFSDVLIGKTVLDLFTVKSSKSIEVGGHVEAATVRAGGNILVRGGICGKEKGSITCKGELRAKYCDSVKIECEGDVHIAKEAINCEIKTNGSLHIDAGSLISGKAHARNGGEIKVLGSDAGVKTHIGIGMNPEVLTAIRDIDEKVKSLSEAAEKIRTAAKPFLADIRRLTPDQREKLTELTRQADELNAQVESLGAEKERLLQETAPVEGASLLVTGRICEGVTITVDDDSLRFDSEFKGPIRIERRKVDNVTEIVGVNQLSGSVHVFPAQKIELPGPNDEAQPDS